MKSFKKYVELIENAPPPIPTTPTNRGGIWDTLGAKDKEKHLEDVWADMTGEARRKALGKDPFDRDDEYVPPQSYSMLSPEQKFMVRKFLGY